METDKVLMKKYRKTLKEYENMFRTINPAYSPDQSEGESKHLRVRMTYPPYQR